MANQPHATSDAGFDRHLSHMFATVHSQVDTGLYCVKRIPNFLEKVALLQLNFAQDLQKICAHELSKGERTGHDLASHHVHGYHKVQHMVGYLASQMTQFSHRLLTEVIEPITHFQKEADKKRQKIFEREERYSTEIKNAEEEVRAQRVSCLKMWPQMQKLQRELTEAETKARQNPLKHKSAVDEAQAALVKYKSKTHLEYKRFEDRVTAANAQEATHHLQLMPALMRELEEIESDRLQLMQVHLRLFAVLFRDMWAPFSQYSDALLRDVSTMNAAETMQSFVLGIVQNFGEPPPPSVLPFDLPCEARTLELAAGAKLVDLLGVDITHLLEQNGLSSSAGSDSVFSSFFSGFSGFSSSGAKSAAAGAGGAKPAAAAAKAAADAAAASSGEDPMAKAVLALRDLKIPDEDPSGCDIVRATFDFESNEPDDVDFKVHDLIRVIKKPDDTCAENIQNGEWWIGRVLSVRPVARKPDGRAERVFVDGTFPSNYVETLAVGSNITLRHLLELRGGRFLLHEFLKSEYSQENLDFWLRAEDFRCKALLAETNAAAAQAAVQAAAAGSAADQLAATAALAAAHKAFEPLRAAASEIFAAFIAPDAPEQININSDNRTTLTKRLAALKAASGGASQAAAGGALLSDLFDNTQLEIFRLLSSDSFMRFKKSPHWYRMLRHYEVLGMSGRALAAAAGGASGAVSGAAAGATAGARTK